MLPLRILVAEDNLVNQMVVTKMLERLSCEADFVADGRQAVEAARSSRYDVIFMDVMMPVMGGQEASRRIRTEETEGHRAHIIAITANAMDSDRIKCLDAGMDDYMTKPFVLDTLREKLRIAADAL